MQKTYILFCIQQNTIVLFMWSSQILFNRKWIISHFLSSVWLSEIHCTLSAFLLNPQVARIQCILASYVLSMESCKLVFKSTKIMDAGIPGVIIITIRKHFQHTSTNGATAPGRVGSGTVTSVRRSSNGGTGHSVGTPAASRINMIIWAIVEFPPNNPQTSS